MEDKKLEKIHDETLEEVSGGGWSDSDWFYKSGETPLFRVGDRAGPGLVVAAVNEEKSGMFRKEFTYRVVYRDNPGKVFDEKAYESQILIMIGPVLRRTEE